MAAKSPININATTEEELMTLPNVFKKWAKAIVSTRKHLGGSMTVDDFKSIIKIGANIWQPLIEQGIIVFGPPGAARHDHQISSKSDSFPNVPLTQGASSPDPSDEPPTQPTPVHMATACLQFPPKGGMDTLTPILNESSTLGIHPGLGGPDPERGQLGLRALQVPHPTAAGHPTRADGPEEQSPGHVSPTGQSPEEVADPQGKTTNEVDQYIWLLKQKLAAEHEQWKATKAAWKEEIQQKTSLQTALQEVEVAWQDEVAQRKTITHALKGELVSTHDQFCSATHSYQDKIAVLDQTCAEAKQKAKVLRKQWDDYKKECDKAKMEISALESTNKLH